MQLMQQQNATIMSEHTQYPCPQASLFLEGKILQANRAALGQSAPCVNVHKRDIKIGVPHYKMLFFIHYDPLTQKYDVGLQHGY